MIRKVESLVVAENTVNFILADERVEDVLGYIESYQNGREQGLMVWTPNCKTEAYYICIQRTWNEGVTVYMGNYSMQSISEDACKNSKSFDTPQEAADFIVAQVVSEQS